MQKVLIRARPLTHYKHLLGHFRTEPNKTKITIFSKTCTNFPMTTFEVSSDGMSNIRAGKSAVERTYQLGKSLKLQCAGMHMGGT